MKWIKRLRERLSRWGAPPRYWNPPGGERVRRRHEASRREVRRYRDEQKRRWRRECADAQPGPPRDDDENELDPETRAAWKAEVDRQFRLVLQVALTVSLLVVDSTLLLDVLIVMALGALAFVCRHPECF